MRILSSVSLLAAALAVALPQSARADVIATLTLDDSTTTISQGETQIVRATLHLANNSDPLVTNSFDTITQNGTILSAPGVGFFRLGDPPRIPGSFVDFGVFASSFANLDILPGQDLDFALATLTPTTALSPGTYSFGPTIEGTTLACAGLNCFSISGPAFEPVASETVIVTAAVPEPGSLAILTGSLLGLLCWSRANRAA